MVGFNLISSAVQATANIAGAAASAVGSTASAVGSVAQAGASRISQFDFQNMEFENALREVGLADEYNSLTAGEFNQQNLAQAIAEASPELNSVQVTASVDVVLTVMERARQNITQNIGSLQDVRELPQTIRNEWQRVSNQLTGQEFVSQLQNQGLSAPQAVDVSNVIAERFNQMQGEAEQALGSVQQALIDVQNQVAQTADQAVEATGDVVSTTSLSWLIFSIVLVGLAGLGGYQLNDEPRIHEEARDRGAKSGQTRGEPTWADERPRRAGNI
jgi:hypothetical protein